MLIPYLTLPNLDCIAKWRELGDISLGLFMCICFTSLYIGLDLVSFVLFCFGRFCFDFLCLILVLLILFCLIPTVLVAAS